MVSSRIYVGAGICVLAIGVTIGAPAVAAADPEAVGAVTASSDETANVSLDDATTSAGAADSAADAEQNAVEGVVTTTFGSGREPGDPVLTSADSPTSTVGNAPAPTSLDSPPEAPAVPVSAPEDDSAVITDDSDSVTSNPQPMSSDSDPNIGVATPAAVEPEPAGIETPPIQQPVASNVPPIEPAPAIYGTPPVPYLVLFGAWVVAPIFDVVAAVHYVVTAVVVGSLTQLQYGLAQLFAVTGVEPVLDSLALAGVEVRPAAGAPLGSQFAPASPFSILLNAGSTLTPLNAALSGESVAPAHVATSAASAPGKSVADSVQSFISDVGRKLLESPSLMALAVAALPGLGGLVLLTTSGVRIGYRQAKVSFVMRQQDIARFALMGPIGIARSQSVVSVHVRASRAHALDQNDSRRSRLKLVC
ncbi:hypothetical protein [Mycolicibacterium sp. XJ870]